MPEMMENEWGQSIYTSQRKLGRILILSESGSAVRREWR